MHKVSDVIEYLVALAPPGYQEDYDNSGLVVGNASADVTGILISIDITEEVLQEAKSQQCNLIIAHHPLIFKPLYHLTGQGQVEKCLAYAIKNDLSIYVLHTNLDNVAKGVNWQLGKILGLQDLSILAPKSNTIGQLVTFVPASAAESVLNALHAAGAGQVGAYTHCSFTTTGRGAFMPTAAANPRIGMRGQLEQVEESRLEVTFPWPLEDQIVSALQEAHPYETAAYQIYQLKNKDPQVGAGMIGRLPEALDCTAFLAHLKTCFNLVCIRHTAPINRPIELVAVCGGSGSHLIREARRQKADVLVTADVKYHDFFQAEGELLIADIGHYESEVGTKELIYTLLSEKFANIALLQCKAITNPIQYF